MPRGRPRKVQPVAAPARTTFSFIIPTHREDRPLKRCLDSIAYQLDDDDEIIVVGDTHDGDLPGVEALVKRYDAAYQQADVRPRFRYLALDAGHHCWGHCQLNYAMSQARGGYIHCNDDDDVWTPEAVSLMRKAANIWPGRPLLFQFRSQFGTIFWERVGQFERNHIGGHCLVVPNQPGKTGQFACAYNGDFDWLESAVNAYGGPQEAIWLADLVAQARPA